MMEKLKQLSITDGLTKLFNSRYFHTQLENEINRTRRYQRPLSLLMMEISNQFYLAARNESFQRSKPSMRIYEVLEWLRTNFAQTCSLQELATRFSYHPTYLSAAFKRESGIALVPYITKLRIAAAKEMLLKSEMRIAEIAEACGFTDDKHFMKVFKAHEYTTPTQYRYSFDRRRVNKE